MARTFTIKVDVREYRTEYYEVQADSFDEARDKFNDGEAEWVDSGDCYDSDTIGIDEIECEECNGGEWSCECASSDLLADLGL